MYRRAPLPNDPRREAQRVWSTRIILTLALGALLLGLWALLPDAVDATLRVLF